MNGQAGILAARGVSGAPGSRPGSVLRCLVVDDHLAIRVGLRELLAAESDFEVLDALATAESAVAFAERTRLDVAVVDYQLGAHSGLWVSRKLKRLPHPPAVLIYSAFSDHLLTAACVVAQANGLVSKGTLGATLCDRIRQVAGGATRHPVLAPTLADSVRRRLDPEEQAIFRLLLRGNSTGEITRTLDLARGELDARMWVMIRKLERLDPVR